MQVHITEITKEVLAHFAQLADVGKEAFRAFWGEEFVMPRTHSVQVLDEKLLTQQVQERFAEAFQKSAIRIPLSEDEGVSMGDLLCVDVVALSARGIVPATVHADYKAFLEPELFEIGLGEQLVGLRIGESIALEMLLSEEHPREHLRGQILTYTITLRAAWKLQFPKMHDLTLFDSLGRGHSLDEVMSAFAKECVEEHQEQQDMLRVNEILDEVLEVFHIEIPESELRNASLAVWEKGDGANLRSMGFQEGDLIQAQALWLEDPRIEEEVRYTLQRSVLLPLLAEELELFPSSDEVHELLKLPENFDTLLKVPLTESDIEDVRATVEAVVLLYITESLKVLWGGELSEYYAAV